MKCSSSFIMFYNLRVADGELSYRGSCFAGMLVLIHILIQLGFEVIYCFINGFVKIQRGTFGNHLLFFYSGANADFSLMVFADFHYDPDTGYL